MKKTVPRAPAPKRPRRAVRSRLWARLSPRVALEADAGGQVVAHFNGQWQRLGAFGAGAAEGLQALRAGVPFPALAAGGRNGNALGPLARRLCGHGLLEFALKARRGRAETLVIEPQGADYWPDTTPLANADVVVLSRFAYLRRRDQEMVLESPRAGALFRICDPQMAAAIAALATPRSVKRLRREGFKDTELLAVLAGCQIILKVADGENGNLRQAEGDDDLVFWDFHDLLFHARSTEGRHADPLGGVYPHLGFAPAPPALRPSWPGRKIALPAAPAGDPEGGAPLSRLAGERHSVRAYDDARPVTIDELSQFLHRSARVLSKQTAGPADGQDLEYAGLEYAVRPYPSAGASYELELYLAVDKCDGLARGLYHYDADAHALVLLGEPGAGLEALLTASRFAMDAPAVPQILIVMAARFGRMSWKYSGLAYALILKDVGVLTQTFYLTATQLRLGGCAIGTVNIDLFAKLTGLEFHVEGPVGQFALGRELQAAHWR